MGASLVTQMNDGCINVTILWFCSRPADLGRTNYLGVAGAVGVVGCPTWDNHEGIFTNRSKSSFASIRDGASNTLMFGEAVGGTPQPEFFYSWMGVGAMPTAFGFGQGKWWQFDSCHPGVVQFAVADGSATAVSKHIDKNVLVALSGMREGTQSAAPH